VVLLHISNRYLDLEQVLSATFATLPGLDPITIEDHNDDGYVMTGSTVVVYGKNSKIVDRYRTIHYSRNLPEPKVKPWTDDFSDILGPFLSQYRKHH
jgi:hypothetical protein